jgi:hypothetical protein
MTARWLAANAFWPNQLEPGNLPLGLAAMHPELLLDIRIAEDVDLPIHQRERPRILQPVTSVSRWHRVQVLP